MTKKLWANMNLTEKTQAYNKMRDRFPDRGVTSTSEAKIMQLCEMNIPADNDAIGAVIRGELSTSEIKLSAPVKPSTDKPKAIFGERSISDAIRLSNDYNETVSEDEQRSWHFFIGK